LLYETAFPIRFPKTEPLISARPKATEKFTQAAYDLTFEELSLSTSTAACHAPLCGQHQHSDQMAERSLN
jgi:hypothetical protein